MRKFLLTLTTLCIALFAQAQDVNTMYIYRNNGNIEEIPVTDIDSITFTKPATNTPDVPTEPGQPTITAGEAIDLGLSVKWASCNVGATKPYEYGGYYAWGETEEKDDYGWDTYKWCSSYDSYYEQPTLSKYCNDDNKTTLDPEDDVAQVKWGGNWRMPTEAELDELHKNCTWEWTTLNGINGYELTGPNGNSIFLPAAGDRDGTETYDQGEMGFYWTSTVERLNFGFGDESRKAWGIRFWWDAEPDYVESFGRSSGRSVRPVCE